jgi:hypothetical protein
VPKLDVPESLETPPGQFEHRRGGVDANYLSYERGEGLCHRSRPTPKIGDDAIGWQESNQGKHIEMRSE